MTKMRFIADIEDATHTVEVDDHGSDDGKYTMVVDGKSYVVDAALMRSQIVSMLIDNHSYDVDVDGTGQANDTLDGRMQVRVRGRVVRLDILDERRRKMREAASAHLGGAGTAKIESPMPGKIVRILVKEGETVTRGQGIIVVEAMKMENELKSPKDGTIGSLQVKEGQAVTGGAFLCVVE
jgi:biotin carboxyl carrier protein